MSGKFALIIGNTEYTDPGLAQLTAPGKDAEDFARVLKQEDICAFDDVKILLNQPESIVSEAIDEFFDHKKPDDLLLLYFSGHGVRDELGALYLAVKNSNRFRLRSTAIKSDFIREAMDQSRSKRLVLILDCCNSGAFAHGTKSATGISIGTAPAFEAGYGRVILTASDSTQFAWEGDRVIGDIENSLFTHFLVEGLRGEADLDSDGRITVDELYDYAYEKVKLATPKQTPSKFSSKQQGEIVLRQNMRVEDIKHAPLPAALLDSLENPFSDVRFGAVQQLIKLLNGKNLALARSAKETLERIAESDDSHTVSRAASQSLEAIRQAERLAQEKSEIATRAKVEREREALEHEAAHPKIEVKAIERTEEQRVAISNLSEFSGLRQQTESNKIITRPKWTSIFWITLGWAIGFTIGWSISAIIILVGRSVIDPASNDASVLALAIGFTTSGAIGGFVTAITLRIEHVLSTWRSILWIALGWAIGLAIVGVAIIEVLTNPNLRGNRCDSWRACHSNYLTHRTHSLSPEKHSLDYIGLAIRLGIGGVIGAVALVLLIEFRPEEIGYEIALTIAFAASGAIIGAIGGTIGGFVMIWQIRNGNWQKGIVTK